MEQSERTDAQKEALLNVYMHFEIKGTDRDRKWPSVFYNLKMPDKKKFSSASELCKSLSDEEIQKRLAVRHWEEGAFESFEWLKLGSLDLLKKSIDPRQWAEIEIDHVEFLLAEGYNGLRSTFTCFCQEEIPRMYMQLVNGEWEDFILIDELKHFEDTKSKCLKDNVKIIAGLLRKQAHHKDYYPAHDIQALIWYTEYLKEIMRDGITFYDDQYEAHDDNGEKENSNRKHVEIKSLQRSNDGYEAIKASFDNFAELKDRIPKWPELIAHMAEQPPLGFNVTASYKGGIVSELSIEGVKNPIDREAFRKRYERYFPKPDIKPDIS